MKKRSKERKREKEDTKKEHKARNRKVKQRSDEEINKGMEGAVGEKSAEEKTLIVAIGRQWKTEERYTSRDKEREDRIR